MSENWTIQSCVEDWYADKKLSRRKIAFLEQSHERLIEGEIGLVTSFSIADGFYADELDLPSGSYWVQLQADLLDHLKPEKTHWTRLFELNRLLFEFGHLDEYKTMGNKVVTRETEED